MSRTATLETLRADARAIRAKLIEMHFQARSGHVGSGLSCVDLLACAFGRWLRPQDAFILSKGHAASSLYATLNHFGRLSDAELKTYYAEGTLLPAHPAPRAIQGIPFATGSLGHGLPIAVGLAHAELHLKATDVNVLCLLSDGECDEGSVWEAALFAQHHRLGNLTVLVDANGMQAFGRTREVLDLEPLARKWEAFGFHTIEIDGHAVDAIIDALSVSESLAVAPQQPTCIIARTTKGKGVSFMEDRLEWHYLPMTDDEYATALSEVLGSEGASHAE